MMRRWQDMRAARDSGFTLMELLLASALLMVLMAVGFSTLIGVSRTADQARTQHDLNEEGRNALNRMAREIRQASAFTYAINPDGPAFSASGLVAVSLKADFNGDGCAGRQAVCSGTDDAANPEELTYCFNPGSGSNLWLIPVGLTATTSTCAIAGAQPIVAGKVAGFSVEYRSNEYRYDVDDPAGVTTWRELDQAPPPVGDPGVADGNINTNALKGVNSVVLHLKMSKGGHVQDYTTQVDLRNKS
jgi:Tfp pilus assembly protein PilW